jgi:hypothetical protein
MKGIIIALVSILIVLILISGFVIICYDDVDDDKDIEPVEPKIVDDTISPPGAVQGVFLEVQRIHKKGIEEGFRKIGNSWKNKPTYHFEATVDDGTWISNNFYDWDTGYIGWESIKDVEDEQEKSTIEFKIVEEKRKLLRTVEEEVECFKLTYDFKTGRWEGDDSFNDNDGYGHYNGDNYEIWFDLHQYDLDNDQIPYWAEVNILETDPNGDDSELDPDEDGIPTSWEYKWGYDPFSWDNHTYLDPDNDGIENIEEFKMEKWLANPYYQDIFIEVDFMEKGHWYEVDHILFKESQWMVMDKLSAHNIALHIDDGWPGGPTNGGGEYLEYSQDTIDPNDGGGSEYYKYHFSEDRVGIFRYLFIQAGRIGWVNAQDSKWTPDVITLPSNRKWFATTMFPPAITQKNIKLCMAVCFIHELGHSLGLNQRTVSEGIDNSSQVGRNNLPPLQKLKLKIESRKYWDSYESVMNYDKFGKYVLDYSDGSHGEHDADDWSIIDLTYFQTKSDRTYGIGDDFRN